MHHSFEISILIVNKDNFLKAFADSHRFDQAVLVFFQSVGKISEHRRFLNGSARPGEAFASHWIVHVVYELCLRRKSEHLADRLHLNCMQSVSILARGKEPVVASSVEMI